MCIAFFLFDVHPLYSLVIASNRDEYFTRPALPAHFWEESPNVFAGRDKQAGGTWFGMSRNGRVALITNYRESQNIKGAPSRGDLTRNFLEGRDAPLDYLQSVHASGIEYNGYNLVVADLATKKVAYLGNRGAAAAAGPRELAPGIYGLSNEVLDSPWPKVTLGKQKLTALLEASQGAALDPRHIVQDVMCDESYVEDSELPATGQPIEIERKLRSAFVNTELAAGLYGTSTQSVMCAKHDGVVEWHERFLDTTETKQWKEASHTIRIGASDTC